jgi:ribosome-binding ATPase
MESRIGVAQAPDGRLDALAHVLRVFESDTVPHEKGSVDPIRDLEDVEVELALSNL